MKTLLKRIFPQTVLRSTGKFLRKHFGWRRPRFTTFRGAGDTVLQCCIAYNQYGGYCVPLNARYRPVAQKILSGSVYEAETLEFLTSHCGEGDIVHAGTFFGDFLPALSRSLAPERKVWAFEPNPENYLCASITCQVNRLNNVELRNAGLGERRGFARMMVSDTDGGPLGGISRIVDEGSQGKGLRDVEIVSIDEMVPSDRPVSIIQLDVEYYETRALTGALMTIQRCSPILVLENLPDEDWLSKNILQLGYRVWGKVIYNTVLMKGK